MPEQGLMRCILLSIRLHVLLSSFFCSCRYISCFALTPPDLDVGGRKSALSALLLLPRRRLQTTHRLHTHTPHYDHGILHRAALVRDSCAGRPDRLARRQPEASFHAVRTAPAAASKHRRVRQAGTVQSH